MNAPVLPKNITKLLEGTSGADPGSLARLREKLRTVGERSGLAPERYAQSLLAANGFSDAVLNRIPGEMLHAEKITTREKAALEWQYGRLMHNLGRTEDALIHLQRANDLDSDNPKIIARLSEVLLELHKDYPNHRYDVEAAKLTARLLEIEDSAYALQLNVAALTLVGARELREGVVYTLSK